MFHRLAGHLPGRRKHNERSECHEALGESLFRHRALSRPGDGARAGHLAPRRAYRRPAPFLIVLSAAKAVTFGLGVSFLLSGFPPLLRTVAGSKPRAMCLSLGWLLVSWSPHDNMHVHNGEDLNGLLRIEYGFHVTLMTAGLVLAYSFLTMLRVGEASGESAPTRVR